MKIKPKEVTAKVKLLRNPSPVAMALVDQGACQTPFNVVKRDIRIQRKRIGTTTMPKTLRIKRGKGAQRPAAISKMQFSKAQFPTVEDVNKYLTEKNVEGFGDIEDGNDIWIAPSSEDLSSVSVGKAKSTPGKDAGVTVFILETKADETTDGEADGSADEVDGKPVEKRASKAKLVGGGKATAEKTAASKGAEEETGDDEEEEAPEAILPLTRSLTEKFDWWGAYMSGESDLSGVLTDGMEYDSLPPGMDEVFAAVGITTGNILGTEATTPQEKLAQLQQVGGEFAGITVSLFSIFTAVSGDGVEASAKKASAKWVKSFKASVEALEPEVEAVEETNDSDDNVIAKLTKSFEEKISGLVSKVESLTTQLSRAPTRKSMSDSLDDLVGDDEDEEQTNTQKAAILEDARRMMGGGSRPRGNA